MRFPLFLGLTAACLVAFKVVTIGTLFLGLLIVGSVVLPFVIVGALIFGLVTLVMWTVRFVFFCAKARARRQSTFPSLRHRPAPPARRFTPRLRARHGTTHATTGDDTPKVAATDAGAAGFHGFGWC